MLVKKEIKNLIEKEDLIENYPDLSIQLQPNGFDLTVEKLFKFEKGKIDFSNSERELPEGEEIKPVKEEGSYGWWDLGEGSYKIRTNEKVNLPNDMIGLLFSRSSLLRIGCFTHHALVDSGFKGKLEFILKVGREGLKLKENGRVSQIVFRRVKETEEYKGIHKEK
jgi:dUTP pyrophosphatase